MRWCLSGALDHARVAAAVAGLGGLQGEAYAPFVAEVEDVGDLPAGLQVDLGDRQVGGPGASSGTSGEAVSLSGSPQKVSVFAGARAVVPIAPDDREPAGLGRPA